MPNTLTYGITYPSGTVAPNVPIVMQTQAESVEAALAALQARTTGTLALGALYGSFGGAYGAPALSKDANGFARLDGVIGIVGTSITMTSGTQYLIATVPVGYRPATDKMYIPPTSSAMAGSGRLFVRSNGDVHFENSTTFTGVVKASFFIGIDGFTWKTV